MDEPALVDSPHCCRFERDGRPYQVAIHRMETQPDWVLEVVDEDGTSFVFDERVADDADAAEAGKVAIQNGEMDPLPPELKELVRAFEALYLPARDLKLVRSPAYAYGRFTAVLTAPSPTREERLLGGLVAAKCSKAERVAAEDALVDLLEAVDRCLAADMLTFEMVHTLEGLASWTTGYVEVVQEDPVWMASDVREEELGPIMALAGLAKAGLEDSEGELPKLEAEAERIAAAALAGSRAWDAARRAEAEAEAKLEVGATVRRGAPKVGRNDPCPCGSGKKFKKCCLRG